MSATKKLAEFVCHTNYADLPEKAIKNAKSCLLDGIGAALAGYQHGATKKIHHLVGELGGQPQATLIGSGDKTSAPLAGLVNGTMCHVMDFDDTNWKLKGHPTAVLLPTILAIGEQINSSGKEILVAYILGYEAACKIATGVKPGHYERGYHNTSTIGVFGATTAAGKLFNLSGSEIEYAYGIAGSRSAGLRANFGTMTKSLHAGMAAHDGIMAALLAKQGYTSNPRIFETNLGFGSVMGDGADFDLAFQKLGNPLDIISSGSVFKRFPSCARTHTAVDAVLELLHEHHFNPEKIVSVKCGTDEECFKILIYPRPHNGLGAKFSLPYCVARACIDGDLRIEHFSDQAIRDPDVIGLMGCVEHYVSSEIIEKGYDLRGASKVTIELEGGQILEKSIETAKGNPDHPLSFNEIVEKFRTCSKAIINEDNAEKIITLIHNMQDIDEINKISRLLISRAIS